MKINKWPALWVAALMWPSEASSDSRKPLKDVQAWTEQRLQDVVNEQIPNFENIKSKIDAINTKMWEWMQKDFWERKSAMHGLSKLVEQLRPVVDFWTDNNDLNLHSEWSNLTVDLYYDSSRYINSASELLDWEQLFSSNDKSKWKYQAIFNNATITKVIIKPDFSVEKHITDGRTWKTRIEQ